MGIWIDIHMPLSLPYSCGRRYSPTLFSRHVPVKAGTADIARDRQHFVAVVVAWSKYPLKRRVVSSTSPGAISFIEGLAHRIVLKISSVPVENMKRKATWIMLIFALNPLAPCFKDSCPGVIFRIVWNANPARLVVKILAKRNRIAITDRLNRIRPERDDGICSEHESRHTGAMAARVETDSIWCRDRENRTPRRSPDGLHSPRLKVPSTFYTDPPDAIPKGIRSGEITLRNEEVYVSHAGLAFSVFGARAECHA